MGDEQGSHLRKHLQPSATRVPIILLQRVEEIIPAVRESLVSIVSRRESYHVSVWIDDSRREEKFQGNLYEFALSIDSDLLTQIL
jgi:hypothetical protein